MKKRMMLAALMAALAMTVCACGSKGAAEDSTAAETETAVETASEEAAGEETEAALPEELEVNYSVGLTDEGYLDGVTPTDFMTLPDYKKCELKKDAVEVTDEEVQTMIDSLLQQYEEELQVTDRAVKDGDSINLDYVGKVDGVAFQGGDTQGNGADLVIGSGSYIDDFEQQLIGKKPGDNVQVTVTFPENYGNEELNGKEAVFDCTINYITETILPELTDDFVAENLQDSYNVATVAELKDQMRTGLEDEKKYTAVWEWLLDNTTFTQEPETVIEGILDTYVSEATNYATNYGMSLEDYLSAMQIESEEAFRDSYRETVTTFAHRYVITQAICEAENMPCDDKALDDYFEGADYSEYISYFGAGYVKMQVNFQRVCDKILETAVVK